MEVPVLQRRLFLADEASGQDWIDGLVMPFPAELAARWRRVWVRAPILSVEQALALTGLFLRAHGDFTTEVDRQGVSIHAEHGHLYSVAAAALLPGITCWLVAATEAWRSSGDPELSGLAEAVIVRLGRSLKARDYLQVRLRAPNRDAVWSDVLFFFEAVLVSLQGAMDAAARFLHIKYELPERAQRANWGHKRWRQQLEASGIPASSFQGQRLWNLDVLVGDLRNSIHGEVLSHELKRTVEAGEDPLTYGYMRAGIAIEPELATRIIEAAKEAGWRLQTFSDGVALLDPWHYAEMAIETVAAALASVVDAVNQESFDKVEVTPAFEKLWTGSPTWKENARLMVGVGVLPPYGS